MTVSSYLLLLTSLNKLVQKDKSLIHGRMFQDNFVVGLWQLFKATYIPLILFVQSTGTCFLVQSPVNIL